MILGPNIAIAIIAINIGIASLFGLIVIILAIVIIVQSISMKAKLNDIVTITAALDTTLMKRILPIDVSKRLCGIVNADYQLIKSEQLEMEKAIEASIKRLCDATDHETDDSDATTNTPTTPVKGNHGETIHLTGFTSDQTFLMEETKPMSLQGLTPTKVPTQSPTNKVIKR